MVDSVGCGLRPSAWLMALGLASAGTAGVAGTARAAEAAEAAEARGAAGAIEAARGLQQTMEPGGTGVVSVQFPVVVHVYTDSAQVDAEGVRAAIAAELGGPAVHPQDARAAQAEGAVTVSYRSTARELAVSYEQRGGTALTRIVAAPESLAEVAAVAALLAGNLARDQTTALLGRRGPLPPPPPPASKPGPAAVRPAPASSPARRASPPEQPANAAFFYPLSTNFGRSNLKTHLDFNLLYGRIGTLDGFQLGTVSVVEEGARGMQVAIGANVVRGTVDGLQLAGALNAAGAGMTGAQLTTGVNYAGSVDGFQVSPLTNLANGTVHGAQLAFGLNRAGDVDGLQVGLINLAGRVRGVQLGLVNVAEDVDGLPIGLVSVTRSGGVHPVSWASNTSYGNFGLKFATRYTYTLLSVSAHHYARETLFGPGFLVGASIPVLPSTFFETDVGVTHLFGNSACCSDNFWNATPRSEDQTLLKLRASLRYAFFDRLSVFGGLGVTGRIRYPLREQTPGDEPFPERPVAEPQFRAGGEFFGGIQL